MSADIPNVHQVEDTPYIVAGADSLRLTQPFTAFLVALQVAINNLMGGRIPFLRNSIATARTIVHYFSFPETSALKRLEDAKTPLLCWAVPAFAREQGNVSAEVNGGLNGSFISPLVADWPRIALAMLYNSLTFALPGTYVETKRINSKGDKVRKFVVKSAEYKAAALALGLSADGKIGDGRNLYATPDLERQIAAILIATASDFDQAGEFDLRGDLPRIPHLNAHKLQGAENPNPLRLIVPQEDNETTRAIPALRATGAINGEAKDKLSYLDSTSERGYFAFVRPQPDGSTLVFTLKMLGAGVKDPRKAKK